MMDNDAVPWTSCDGDATSTANASASVRSYRAGEIARVVGALQKGESLLIVAGQGMGLSTLSEFIAEELRARGHNVALLKPSTVKQLLVDLCTQLGVDPGKATTAQLQTMIEAGLIERRAFLLFDDAHRLPASFRDWLNRLLCAGQPMTLFACLPPRKDVFLRLPRIELKPLPHAAIREIMIEAGRETGKEFTPAELAVLAERCGGNPMLARRVVREEYLGLDPTAPDHTEWIDGTPMLIAALLCFTVLRFIGRGLHSSDLYLIGGLLAVAVGILRVLIYSMPRKSSKFGG